MASSMGMQRQCRLVSSGQWWLVTRWCCASNLTGANAGIAFCPARQRARKFLASLNFGNEIKGYGGPGGCIKIVEFTEFFVGQNKKSSRILPYTPVTQRSEPCSRMTAFGAGSGMSALILYAAKADGRQSAVRLLHPPGGFRREPSLTDLQLIANFPSIAAFDTRKSGGNAVAR